MDNQNSVSPRGASLAVMFVVGLMGILAGYYAIPHAGALPSGIGQTRVVSQEEQAVTDVVKRASPAVVSVIASQTLQAIQQGAGGISRFCNDPFFQQFFGDQCVGQPQSPQRSSNQKQEVGAGSGFIVSSDGLIVTNKHVVSLANATYTVVTSDGKKYDATIVAQDPVRDIAVLRIKASGLPVLTLGDSDTIKIGQTAIAIGNALGQFSNTVSKGVISGLSRSIVAGNEQGSSERLDQVIQTDAAINPGNSGGPLLNLSGDVIGINSAIVEGAQSVGFAIPVNQVKRDISQVSSMGKISYAFLGVQYMITSQGAEVSDVTPASPADKAGIKAGDIILSIDGKKISPGFDFAGVIQNKKVGDSVKLQLFTGGEMRSMTVILSERT